MAKTVTASAPNLDQQNAIARSIVLNNSISMVQSIFSTTLSGTIPGQVVNIPIRNVGLLKRFVVEITGNLTQGAAETQTASPWGIANLLSQVVFTDLSNQTRINTSGWHLHALASARRQMAYGAAFTSDSPIAIGNQFGVIKAPASFTTVQPFRMFYEVPITYGDYDLRGGIFANVVNATMNLQLTFNPNFFVPSTATSNALAGYKSSTAQAGVLSSVTINVYQVYLDQIPSGDKGPILPMLDLSQTYLLNNTAVTGLAVNQDNPVPFSNFRNFMSTFIMFDNQGLNAGTDVNYLALQSANYTNILKVDPFMSSMMTRNIMNDDFPVGNYYFDFRQKPVSTIQYGNMQLLLNPSSVAGTATQMLVGFEALAFINQVTQAGSLYAN